MASRDEVAARWLGSYYWRLDTWPHRPAAQQDGTYFIVGQARLWRVRDAPDPARSSPFGSVSVRFGMLTGKPRHLGYSSSYSYNFTEKTHIIRGRDM